MIPLVLLKLQNILEKQGILMLVGLNEQEKKTFSTIIVSYFILFVLAI